ncbi:MAG: UbiA family prenyltransferase [Elusimicrobiales bacterium]
MTAAELTGILYLPLRLRAHVVALFVAAYFVVCRRMDGAVSGLELGCGLGFAALLQTGYLANKLYDRAEDAFNGETMPLPGGADAWQRGLTAVFAVVCLGMWAAAPALLPILLYSAAAAAAYSHPAVRLKGYPLVKPLVNTANFFLVAVMAPALIADGGAWTHLAAYLAGTWRLLLIVLSLTLLFDVRDLRGDERAGLRTLPALLGRVPVLGGIIFVTLLSGLADLAAASYYAAAAQLLVAAAAAGAIKERGRRYYDALALAVLLLLALLF